MKTNHPIAIALALLLPAAAALAAESAPRRPNILLVLADDLGYSDLGCYGGEIPTPNIDALGKSGLRFTQMTNSARCCPSRASLLTGLHPAQAGIPDFGGKLGRDCVTLAEVLGTAGYQTFAVGKWHVGTGPGTDPVARGFREYYGFTQGHSEDQWSPGKYTRLPKDHPPEMSYAKGKFFATDAFTDYALEFINQAGQNKHHPWFLYLAHSAPHFPLQAPSTSVDALAPIYQIGWDVLRQQRFERMKLNGLINHDGWQLTPRSLVPVDEPAIANGFQGQPNPAWDTLDADRRADLARRMAVYAAMVKHVDDGIGRIVAKLRADGTFDHTLILFLSDNGACYEWGPFGFDVASRKGVTTLHQGDELAAMGGPGTYHSYGSAWANLCNTPFRMYKHFTHQGGISTPFIIHWPAGLKDTNRWVREPAHLMDIMPTLVEVAGASYPTTFHDQSIQPLEGVSLTPLFHADGALKPRPLCYQHEGARAIRSGQWKLVLGKRLPAKAAWELYDMDKDPCETTDLARQFPDRVQAMTNQWNEWAARTKAIPTPGR